MIRRAFVVSGLAGLFALSATPHRRTPLLVTPPIEAAVVTKTASAAATGGITSLTNANSTPRIAASFMQDEASRARDWDDLLRDVRHWAASDRAAAIAWALGVSDEHRAEAVEAVCLGLAARDPADAVQLAVQYGLQDRPGGVLESIVQQWAALDAAGALAWTNRQPAGELRDQLFGRVALACAASAPAEAARLVVECIAPGAVQMESALSVVHRWATTDLSGAARWVARFPDGVLRERAIDELAGILAERDSSENHPIPAAVPRFPPAPR